jgi:hypothetical protein
MVEASPASMWRHLPLALSLALCWTSAHSSGSYFEGPNGTVRGLHFGTLAQIEGDLIVVDDPTDEGKPGPIRYRVTEKTVICIRNKKQPAKFKVSSLSGKPITVVSEAPKEESKEATHAIQLFADSGLVEHTGPFTVKLPACK